MIDLVWRHMRLDGYPGSGLFLIAGFVCLVCLIESALIIPLRKRRLVLTHLPLASVTGQLHTILGVAALVTGLIHSAGHFDPDKSGTYLLISISVTTALGLTGRLFERKLRDSVFSKLWRQAHRLFVWIVLGCLVWHLIAVIPLIF